MGKQTTINVRLTTPLSEYLERQVGVDALFDNVSEYVRDLIRRDLERTERAAFERLRGELQAAFAVPESEYRDFHPETWLDEMKARRAAS